MLCKKYLQILNSKSRKFAIPVQFQSTACLTTLGQPCCLSILFLSAFKNVGKGVSAVFYNITDDP